MKHMLWVLALVIFQAGFLNGQTKPDEEAVRNLPQAFCMAFSKHDGHELAKIIAEDIDFVTVADVYLHGRADFEKFHVRILSGRFKEAKIKPIEITARFLRPDLAVVHWSWRAEGDKNFYGAPRDPRFGMMTMVAEKKRGEWLVVVAQNGNSVLGIPPELQEIRTPIKVPGANQKQ